MEHSNVLPQLVQFIFLLTILAIFWSIATVEIGSKSELQQLQKENLRLGIELKKRQLDSLDIK